MADVCHLCICSVVFACHSTSRSRNVRSKNVQLDQERESQEKSGQEKDCQEMSIKKSRSRNGRSKNVHDSSRGECTFILVLRGWKWAWKIRWRCNINGYPLLQWHLAWIHTSSSKYTNTCSDLSPNSTLPFLWKKLLCISFKIPRDIYAKFSLITIAYFYTVGHMAC